ncbi:polymerase, partial [Sinorhizobium meliloti]
LVLARQKRARGYRPRPRSDL